MALSMMAASRLHYICLSPRHLPIPPLVSSHNDTWNPLVLSSSSKNVINVVAGASKRPKSSHISGQSKRNLRNGKREGKDREEILDGEEDDFADEEALEALFAQLEKDLEDARSSGKLQLNEISDQFENELAALLDVDKGIDSLSSSRYEETRTDNVSPSARLVEEKGGGTGDEKYEEAAEEEDEADGGTDDDYINDSFEHVEKKDEDDQFDLKKTFVEARESSQKVIQLEKWQLKKLAGAVELGRRHVKVKALAAETGLDRSDVLAWLRNPPPELLMLSITDDEDDTQSEVIKGTAAESPSKPKEAKVQKEAKDNSRSWFGQKRLKKVYVATFERVFERTERPNEQMISSLVHLTHVPRSRIIQWFEARRQHRHRKSFGEVKQLEW